MDFLLDSAQRWEMDVLADMEFVDYQDCQYDLLLLFVLLWEWDSSQQHLDIGVLNNNINLVVSKDYYGPTMFEYPQDYSTISTVFLCVSCGLIALAFIL